jgi:type VI protein secretion system component VasK
MLDRIRMRLNSLFTFLCLLSCGSCQHQAKKPDTFHSLNSSTSTSTSTPQLSEEVIKAKNAPSLESRRDPHVTVAKENPLSAIPWYCILSLVAFDGCTTEKGTHIGK